MDYLPEWKIYLWKKLILNKDGEFDGELTPDSFRFFNGKEGRELMRDKLQKSIDTVNLAVKSGSLIDIRSGTTSFENSYFHYDSVQTLSALIELTRKPSCIEITNIHLDKKILTDFKDLFTVKDFGPDGYSKILEGKELTIADLGYSCSSNYMNNSAFSYLSFEIRIDKAKLRAKLDAYLNDFGENKFIGPKGIWYIDAKKQSQDILSAIHKLSEKYGQNFTITADEIAKAGGWYLKNEHHYRFYETIFTLEMSGQIEITNLRKEEVIISLLTVPVSAQSAPIPVQKNESSIKAEITIGKLIAYSDGTIRYDGKILDLRPQVKDLCRLFMERHNQLVNADDIKEKIIKASKRKATSFDTISKYVSELHTELQIHFGKAVITNQPKDGWIFNP